MTQALAQELSNVGVGGSEIAAACGFSRYRSRYGLWLEKTGRVPPFSGNIHTRLGQLCEPRARQLYANATGADVAIPPCSEFHPEIPWARCTPDGRWTSDPGHLVQIKCVGYFVGRRWKYQGVPVEIQAQCQWEMFVTGAHTDDVAALVGSDELEWERYLFGDITDPQRILDGAILEIFPQHRSEADIATLRAGAEEFMDMVWRDIQPPVDHSEDARQRITQRATGEAELQLIDAADVIDEWLDAHRIAEDAERALDLAKNRIRERLAAAGANRINTPAGPVIWTGKPGGTRQLRHPPGWGKDQ